MALKNYNMLSGHIKLRVGEVDEAMFEGVAVHPKKRLGRSRRSIVFIREQSLRTPNLPSLSLKEGTLVKSMKRCLKDMRNHFLNSGRPKR
jgi:hypothetical protein